jgi:DNA-binding NarL/FixJ family response regulator
VDRRLIIEMLRLGVSGVLLRNSPLDELCKAIQVITEDKTFLGRGISDLVIREYRALMSIQQDANPSGLTSREREVLQLIAEGRNNKEIAVRLGVTLKTVEGHRTSIYEKLATQSVAKLTKYAIREGLTSLEG